MRRSVLRPVPSALTTESRERSDSPRTNVRRVPSGDHDGVAKSSLTDAGERPRSRPVRVDDAEPRPVRPSAEANAIRVPSGDQAIAATSSSGRAPSWASPLPSGAALKICPRSLLGTPMNAIRPPSGAQAGPNATGTPPTTRPPVPSAATTRTSYAASWADALAAAEHRRGAQRPRPHAPGPASSRGHARSLPDPRQSDSLRV